MTTLEEFFNQAPRNTDKGIAQSGHGYIEGYYSNELSDKRHLPLKFLEIGVDKGASIKFWTEWFTSSDIYGIDITPALNIENATILSGNAYTVEIVDRFQNNFFDYIIDDGPHTIESQIACIAMWYPKLKIGGKIIIEDIQEFSTTYTLAHASRTVGASYRTIDLRARRNHHDDLMFELTKVN